MITSQAGGLAEVTMALLKRTDGTKIRYFSTSAEVLKYLAGHPDVDFLLEPVTPGIVLSQMPSANYGVQHGDVFCGQVRFDSNAGQVVCS